MISSERDAQWDWRKPELSRAGQTKFWDRQSQAYDTADMTNDNEGEMQAVLNYLRELPFEELIIFGGVIGCRDPKRILEDIFCGKGTIGSACAPKKKLPDIFFNDLAPSHVERARTEILSRCHLSCGAQTVFHSGTILEGCKSISGAPRTLLLGTYDVEAFFRADESHGYPLAGFDEYLKNSRILGDRFWFDWLTLHGGEARIMSTGMRFHASGSLESRAQFRHELYEQYSTVFWSYGDVSDPLRVLALQIVSARDENDGYFISHWYSEPTITDLLISVFPLHDYEVIQWFFPKGMLFCIKRRNVASQGVITMLNNVLGNIIPDEQIATLEAIKSIL